MRKPQQTLKQISIILSVLVLSLSSIALAQENLSLKEQAKRSEEKTLGWKGTAKVGVNTALSSSSNVVGKTDGSSETYGLDVNGSLNKLTERSEWRNGLSYSGATTRTPVLPRYIKSNDLLKFESLYLYTFEDYPNIGPYASVTASAPIFFGEDVRSAPVIYRLQRRDGSAPQLVSSDTFRLTEGFKPLTTRESTGAFWKAFHDGTVQIDVRLGVGAEQTLAEGQFAVTGTATDGAISVGELRNLSQLGTEAGIKAKGKIDQNTGWELGLDTLTPVVSNKEASDDRDALRLTNVDGMAKLSSNLTSWAALSYDYKLTIKPQLFDRAQQSHMFVLNLNYNLF